MICNICFDRLKKFEAIVQNQNSVKPTKIIIYVCFDCKTLLQMKNNNGLFQLEILEKLG